MDQYPPSDLRWECNDCTNKHSICFACKQPGKIGKGLSKCKVHQCGKFYHDSCVLALDLVKPINTKSPRFICPLHYCATCKKSGDSKQSVHCFRCPTAYHVMCMPDNIEYLTKAKENRKTGLILCPKHINEPAAAKSNDNHNQSQQVKRQRTHHKSNSADTPTTCHHNHGPGSSPPPTTTLHFHNYRSTWSVPSSPIQHHHQHQQYQQHSFSSPTPSPSSSLMTFNNYKSFTKPKTTYVPSMSASTTPNMLSPRSSPSDDLEDYANSLASISEGCSRSPSLSAANANNLDKDDCLRPLIKQFAMFEPIRQQLQPVTSNFQVPYTYLSSLSSPPRGVNMLPSMPSCSNM
ncbi:hypothetical protein SAMD00019534_012780 [Acytostelium subglobosum LB1]|uniref:hypothetical protein n=1 Tax=Acytostelium subglobosum LB1 TaxID=1410327 RepID=UPI000644FBF5|nr:hypothetical protein SAMD00019534_012780 [Acytostelium subglobosum LB1]GAM18103.1 hypothetical protein SAMD00019534_012780 [Acytostelium subglobosum LB1]|eukprot:XP_012758699.1 hypothetical protein SAMD00019534_012780 [Acytostelium subglobosum LB1]